LWSSSSLASSLKTQTKAQLHNDPHNPSSSLSTNVNICNNTCKKSNQSSNFNLFGKQTIRERLNKIFVPIDTNTSFVRTNTMNSNERRKYRHLMSNLFVDKVRNELSLPECDEHQDEHQEDQHMSTEMRLKDSKQRRSLRRQAKLDSQFDVHESHGQANRAAPPPTTSSTTINTYDKLFQINERLKKQQNEQPKSTRNNINNNRKSSKKLIYSQTSYDVISLSANNHPHKYHKPDVYESRTNQTQSNASILLDCAAHECVGASNVCSSCINCNNINVNKSNSFANPCSSHSCSSSSQLCCCSCSCSSNFNSCKTNKSDKANWRIAHNQPQRAEQDIEHTNEMINEYLINELEIMKSRNFQLQLESLCSNKSTNRTNASSSDSSSKYANRKSPKLLRTTVLTFVNESPKRTATSKSTVTSSCSNEMNAKRDVLALDNHYIYVANGADDDDMFDEAETNNRNPFPRSCSFAYVHRQSSSSTCSSTSKNTKPREASKRTLHQLRSKSISSKFYSSIQTSNHKERDSSERKVSLARSESVSSSYSTDSLTARAGDSVNRSKSQIESKTNQRQALDDSTSFVITEQDTTPNTTTSTLATTTTTLTPDISFDTSLNLQENHLNQIANRSVCASSSQCTSNTNSRNCQQTKKKALLEQNCVDCSCSNSLSLQKADQMKHESMEDAFTSDDEDTNRLHEFQRQESRKSAPTPQPRSIYLTYKSSDNEENLEQCQKTACDCQVNRVLFLFCFHLLWRFNFETFKSLDAKK